MFHSGVFDFRQGDIESAMKYLEMFVELADRAAQLPEQRSACTSLGSMYNSLVSGAIDFDLIKQE